MVFALIPRSAFVCLLLAGCATHADCYDASASDYNKAKALYVAKDYAGSSKLFEANARTLADCFRAHGTTKVADRQAVALGLLTAGEAAHWGNDDARALKLVKEARSQFVSIYTTDSDQNFERFVDEEQAKKDLSGTWTLGVRE